MTKSEAKSLNPVWGCASFFLSVLMFITTTAISGIFPFGAESFITGDLKYQYFDFFIWFRGVLTGSESLFYSTTQALGANTWGLFSYYLASPFNLIILLFNESDIALAIWFITMLKVGCIGLTTWIYLRKRFDLSDYWAVVFTLGFSWSSWMVMQLRNIMWLDGIILLPLVALGVYQLVRKRSWLLTLVSVALSIIVNWYIAYMTVLFAVLLFFLEFGLYTWSKQDDEDQPSSALREKDSTQSLLHIFARRGLLLLTVLIGALGISSFMFLPTVLAMTGDMSTVPFTAAEDSADPLNMKKVLILGITGIFVAVATAVYWRVAQRKLSHRKFKRVTTAGILLILICIIFIGLTGKLPMATGLLDVISGFFASGFELTSMPQLFGGTLLLFGVSLFFLSRHIAWKIKLLCGTILCVLVLSCWFQDAYTIWCGFKAPTGFYCRISFLAIFMMMIISALLLSNQDARDAISFKQLVAVGCCVIGAYAVLACFGRTTIPCVLAACVLFGLLLLARKLPLTSPTAKTCVGALLLAGVTFELVLSAHFVWTQLYYGYTQQYHEAYVQNAQNDWAQIRETDSGNFRHAKTYTRALESALNEGFSIGYNEISSYSSAHDGDSIRVLNALGYSHEGTFLTRYSEPQLVLDSLFGVRYVICPTRPAGFVETGFHASMPGMSVWKNPYALALGYEVSEEALNLTLEGTNNPFERQNAVLRAFLGADVSIYHECFSVKEGSSSGASPDQTDTTLRNALNEPDTNELDGTGATTYKVEIPPNSIGYYYAYSGSFENPAIYVSANDEESVVENSLYSDALHMIANASDTTQVITVRVAANPTMNSPEPDTNESLFYALDLIEFEAAINQLSKHQLDVEHWFGNEISGTCTMEHDGLMMLEVPWDSGWDVRVDGQSVKAVPLLDRALTGIPLQAGEHHIQMTFHTPGLQLGIVISLFSVVIVIVLILKTRNRRNEQNTSARERA